MTASLPGVVFLLKNFWETGHREKTHFNDLCSGRWLACRLQLPQAALVQGQGLYRKDGEEKPENGLDPMY